MKVNYCLYVFVLSFGRFLCLYEALFCFNENYLFNVFYEWHCGLCFSVLYATGTVMRIQTDIHKTKNKTDFSFFWPSCQEIQIYIKSTSHWSLPHLTRIFFSRVLAALLVSKWSADPILTAGSITTKRSTYLLRSWWPSSSVPHADSKSGKFQYDFSNSYVLSDFILVITDTSEGKHREETWTWI